MSTSNALIAAGAILPGATGAGEDRDTITARHYTHPALDDRVVVRLVPAVLGAAEDLTCEYLGFPVPERTAEVGTGRRSALGFPAWALVHDPANGHHALSLVKDVERLARTAKSRAGAAKDGFTALGAMLGRSAPHFLPTFYEQAGRIFLEHGNTTCAAAMFGKAREAEEVHDLAVDPERIREVFLEFAFAGALTATALSAHAKRLARKHNADDAYESFRTLCVERTRGGLAPYTGMPEDLRRLAKAAKRDVRVEDERLLRALLDCSAISSASAGFWKHYRSALIGLAAADHAVRDRLVAFVPTSVDALDTWLDILDACGATRALTEPTGTTVPAEWLSSFLAVRSRGWRTTDRSARLLELAGSMTGRLLADGVPVRVLRGWRQGELDLLDLLVAHGVPIAPAEYDDRQLRIAEWLADEGPGRRDLAALATSEDFALGAEFVAYARSTTSTGAVDPEVLRTALAVPGLRVALGRWIRARAAEVATTGLPDLTKHLAELEVVRLAEAFADVPDAAEALATTDVGAALLTTLRTGLLDELGWPALEDAVARLSAVRGTKDADIEVCGEGWPALVLCRGESFVVVGPDDVLAEHVYRAPADARLGYTNERHASWYDGALIVRWPSRAGELAYWSDAPDQLFTPSSTQRRYYGHAEDQPSIVLADGARFTGQRAARRGDTDVPPGHHAYGDGGTVWTRDLREETWCWVEVDPATGELGRTSLPRFVEDFAADGAVLQLTACDLRPAVAATAGSPLGTDGGLHGWRVRQDPDGSWLGEGVDGRRIRLGKGSPLPTGILRLPGGGTLVIADGYDSVTLLDEQGTTVGEVSTEEDHPAYAAGTPFVPPRAWWHVLTARDEAGSAALRAITRQAVDDLLAVALTESVTTRTTRADRLAALRRGEHDDLARAITTALPGLTHPGLIAGVADVVRRAARLTRAFRGYAEIAAAARSVDLAAAEEPAVSDQQITIALDWFGRDYGSSGTAKATTLPDLVAALADTAALPAPGDTPLPVAGNTTWFRWLPHLAALAYRAASPLTQDDQREALVLVLRTIVEHGLAEGAGHWRIVELVVPERTGDVRDRVVPVADGFIALIHQSWHYGDGNQFDGVQFTRTPGTFDVPRGWQVRETAEIGEGFAGDRARRFFAALAEHGPAPWFPDAASRLAELAGIGTSEAVVLLAGMPHVTDREATYLTANERTLLGLSAANAKVARERLMPLSDGFRTTLLAAAVPADPAELWISGPDVAAVAEVWVAAHGLRRPVPDDVLVDVAKQLPQSNAAEFVTGVVNPESTAWLTTDANLRFGGLSVKFRSPTGFTETTLRAVPHVLLWLAMRLPVGSPLRPRLAEALELARQRVAHPGFGIDLGRWTSAERAHAAGDRPARGRNDRQPPRLVGDRQERRGVLRDGRSAGTGRPTAP